MTLDDLIAKARLTVRETVLLNELLIAPNLKLNTADMIDAVKRNLRVLPPEPGRRTHRPSTSGQPLTLRGQHIRYIINSLNSKLLQANTGYAVVKISGRGRGAHGVYQLRTPTSRIKSNREEREHEHA